MQAPKVIEVPKALLSPLELRYLTKSVNSMQDKDQKNISGYI